MIVCPERNFIFVKNHKVAGTSVEVWLSQYCGHESVVTPISDEDEQMRSELGGTVPQNTSIPKSRFTLKDWLRLLIKGRSPQPFVNHDPFSKVETYYPQRARDFFSFCLERNPWDKAVSMYYWELYYQGVGESEMSISDFLLSERAHIISDWNKYADDGTVKVDFVGRFEDLRTDLAHIATTLGVEDFAMDDLPRCKTQYRGSEAPYWEVLDRTCRDRVADICHREITEFGYTFGE